MSQTEGQRILALEVGRYKNLKDLWIPWSDGLALFGPNGAGKTNLLECLALLMGSAQAVGLAGPRLAHPSTDDLAVLVRPGQASLPWPPDLALKWWTGVGNQPSDMLPGLDRALADGAWWELLGASSGQDFETGIASAALPPSVERFVRELSGDPVIRYRLTRLSRRASFDVEGAEIVERTFSRTLVSNSIPSALQEVVEDLPEPFSPMRSALADPGSSPGGWHDILELPATAEPPAVVQWLPRSRTAAELNSDLQHAFTTASGSVAELVATLAELPFATPPQDYDWHWWLHEVGAQRAQEELDLTLPGLSVTAAGVDDADFALSSDVEGRPIELSHTGQADVLEHFSSGERRWIDEALATAAREITRFGDTAALHADRYYDLSDDTVMEAVLKVAADVEQSVLEGGFWTGRAFGKLLEALEPALIAAAHAYVERNRGNQLIEAMTEHSYPGLRLLHPQIVIRVFDEPEAHLHPSAQRRVATAINRLRLRGQNIVIASHSPHFLDLPEWALVHVHRGEGGTSVDTVTDASDGARTALAAQLGINRGELLAGINGVLVVEGLHDQRMLEHLFGRDLRSAGLAVLRMFGTNNVMATAELDFIDRYLDVPIVVLLDYVHAGRVAKGQPKTEEEEKLLQLKKACRRRRRPYQLVGLERPDIVAYLSDAALRQVKPEFPGWKRVLETFERRKSRPPFKPWLAENYGIDLTTWPRIEEILNVMTTNSHEPVGELTRRVQEILSVVPIPGDDEPATVMTAAP